MTQPYKTIIKIYATYNNQWIPIIKVTVNNKISTQLLAITKPQTTPKASMIFLIIGFTYLPPFFKMVHVVTISTMFNPTTNKNK